ncbi:MAG: tetratricopeptide repeat protein [Thermomonas sp.]
MKKIHSLWIFMTMITLLAIATPAAAQRPPRVIPEQGNALVGRLPRGYAGLEPAANPLTTSIPKGGVGAEFARIGSLLQAASMTGDTRLVARADALLARQPMKSDNPDVLRLRAYSAQHRHDFAGALRLLDQLIDVQPRNASARLSRAEVQLVQGRIDKARADCRALALGIDADTGLLCAASLALRTGGYAEASALLDRLLDQFKPTDSRRAFALLARAEVAGRAGDADADARYRAGVAASPGDIRTRVSYARYLRRVGRDAEVEQVLAGSEQSDTAQLQRTLAAVAGKRGNAQSLVASQSRRYELAHAMGSQPEMRDEADFLLLVKQQPEQALALALRNFEQQRDHEDVDILVRAANAAHKADALDGLHEWQQTQGTASADNTRGQP